MTTKRIPPDVFKRWRASLKSERGRRSVSQNEAADRLGVSAATYKRYEKEGTNSEMVGLAMSATLFGLPPYHLDFNH